MAREPAVGVGSGQFMEHHELTAHNSFLLTLAELGPLGFLLWTAAIYFAVKITVRVQVDLAVPRRSVPLVGDGAAGVADGADGFGVLPVDRLPPDALDVPGSGRRALRRRSQARPDYGPFGVRDLDVAGDIDSCCAPGSTPRSQGDRPDDPTLTR